MLGLFLLTTLSCAPLDSGEVIINDKAVYYEYIEGNTEYAVILQAGSRSHSTVWDHLIVYLEQNDHSVLLYDRPGLGKSEESIVTRSVKSITSELEYLIDEVGLKGKKLILVGHSMGGNYQRYFALLHPESVVGLVLIDTPSNVWEDKLKSCLSDKQIAERDLGLVEFRSTLPKPVREEYGSSGETYSAIQDPLDSSILIGLIYGGNQTWPDFYDEKCLSTEWASCQTLLSKKLGSSFFRSSNSSGHQVPVEDPMAVDEMINKMIDSLEYKNAFSAINRVSTLFSHYLIQGETDSLCNLYCTNARLIPPGKNIIDGRDSLCNYWSPNPNYKTVYHKTTSHELKILGDEAYDYGVYEGRTQYKDGSSKDWNGKYLIVWKKIDSEWKIYVDIWNR